MKKDKIVRQQLLALLRGGNAYILRHASVTTKRVRTTCPYCGVGCQMELQIKDNFVYAVNAPFDAAPNYGMLCVKGRFGTDYVRHPGRVRNPLIRVNRDEGRSAKPIWREATNEDNYVFQKVGAGRHARDARAGSHQ